MSQYLLELHFTGQDKAELWRTLFRHPKLKRVHKRDLECVRGRTRGPFQGFGTFEWTKAVRAMSLLLLRSIASIEGVQEKLLIGEGGSVAASLDYSIDKQPNWMLDMFGVDANGQGLMRFMVLRSNSGRKRSGPVCLALNDKFIPLDTISVYVNGKAVKETEALQQLIKNISCDGLPIHEPQEMLKVAV